MKLALTFVAALVMLVAGAIRMWYRQKHSKSGSLLEAITPILAGVLILYDALLPFPPYGSIANYVVTAVFAITIALIVYQVARSTLRAFVFFFRRGRVSKQG